jgi:hypothetical protein
MCKPAFQYLEGPSATKTHFCILTSPKTFVINDTEAFPGVEKMLTSQGSGFVNSDYLLQFCRHYRKI